MSTVESLVVAVFDNHAMAEHAINDLRNTGFKNDDILYSSRQKGGGFFENLKSWITGEETASIGDVAKNLRDRGVPEEAANYYAREREAGHPIVAVSSPGQEQSARNILQHSGGHTHEMAPGSTTAGTAPSSTTAGMGPKDMPSTTYGQPSQTPSYSPTEETTQPGQPMHPQDRSPEGEVKRTPLREEPRIEKSGDVNIRRDDDVRP